MALQQHAPGEGFTPVEKTAAQVSLMRVLAAPSMVGLDGTPFYDRQVASGRLWQNCAACLNHDSRTARGGTRWVVSPAGVDGSAILQRRVTGV
jgi:hypothetical protein